ncbi:MAG: hypothetical protein R3E08_01030 [Thiotrichaceae bacterium]
MGHGTWIVVIIAFDFTDIPSARWDEALTHKIRQWSPFNEYTSYVVWKNTQAQV